VIVVRRIRVKSKKPRRIRVGRVKVPQRDGRIRLGHLRVDSKPDEETADRGREGTGEWER
jgi:hypothetical protein